jgi:hypothetical protein
VRRPSLLPLLAALLAFGCERRPLPVAPGGGIGANDGQPAGGAGGAAGAGGAGAAGADGPALVVALDDEILYVSADGAQVRAVYRFAPPDIPPGSLGGGWVTIAARGRFVLTTRSVNRYDGATDWQQGDRAVLLDDAARVRWEKAFITGDLGPSHARPFGGQIGDAGHAVLSVGWQQLYVAADGGEQPLDDIRTALAPVAGPIVPVVLQAATTLDSSFGWWRPGQPAAFIGHPLDALLIGSTADAHFVFASRGAEGRRVLVDARPSGFEVRAWPADIRDTITSFGSETWQGDDHGGEVVRWNVQSGEIARLPWALPDGMRRLGGPWFDADGGLIVVLRNDHLAGVYRSAAAGPDWTLIGKTMGDVETVRVTRAGGTYVIDTEGTNDRFVPRQSWRAAPPGQEPALRGRSHQIVRPADAISIEAAPAMWNIQLSPDGRRAVYWRAATAGYALVMRDLASAGERQIAFRSLPRSYQIAWNR